MGRELQVEFLSLPDPTISQCKTPGDTVALGEHKSGCTQDKWLDTPPNPPSLAEHCRSLAEVAPVDNRLASSDQGDCPLQLGEGVYNQALWEAFNKRPSK